MALRIIHAEKAYIIIDTENQEQSRLNLMRIIVQLRTELAQARELVTKIREALEADDATR